MAVFQLNPIKKPPVREKDPIMFVLVLKVQENENDAAGYKMNRDNSINCRHEIALK